MRKYGLYLLIAVGLLAGCQKKDMIAENPAAESSTVQSVTLETAGKKEKETEKAQETAAADEKTGENKLDPIPLAVVGEYDGEWDDNQKAIITSRCDKVYLQGNGYDALKKSLASLNEEMTAGNKKEYEEYKSEAEDLHKEYNLTYVCNYEFHPVRFDGTAASMYWLKYYDLGGAHPDTSSSYFNFDAQTGKRLELSDVVEDTDGFIACVKDQLADQAKDGALFDDYEGTVDTIFAGTDKELSLEWAITEKGVSVFFNPYMIAPYAAGTIEASVPFEGNESLFNKTYMGVQTAGWTKEVTPWETVTYKDGASVMYSYEETGEEEDAYGVQNLTIELTQNGKTNTFTEEIYGRIGDTWLIMTDDGRSYLYMEVSSENDWKSMEVFDLNGGTPAHTGSSGDSMNGSPIQTPDAFYLSRRIDALGTYSAYRKFHVGTDGMPESDENVYTKVKVSDSKDDEMALVSTRELPVTMIKEDGSEENEKLPAGTNYYVRATDQESFVEFELEDGRTCRMSVKKSDSGWGFTIDGVSEEDCFEFVPYAG